jgi:hypothetical protein
MLKLFRIIVLLASSLAMQAYACNPDVRTYTSEELGTMFYATHLTSEFPENYVMKAHQVIRVDEDLTFHEAVNDIPRGGLFWALGSGIHNHSGACFDNHRYAVVLPFRELYGQLLNVCPSDMFSLGDFDLADTKTARLFVPKGTDLSGEKPNSVEIQEYDGDLRAAIRLFLEKQKSAIVTLSDVQEGGFSLKDKAMWNGQNINTPDFFKALLVDKPYLSYGKELISHVPKDGILAQIRALNDTFALVKRAIKLPGERSELFDYNIEGRAILAELMINNLRDVFQTQKNHPLTKFSEPLLSQLNKAEKYVHMLKADLLFRRTYGFVATDLYKFLKKMPKLYAGRKRLIDSPEEIKQYLSSVRKQYNSRLGGYGPGEKAIDDFPGIIEILMNLPPALVEKFLNHADIKEKSALYRNAYWFHHYITRDYGCVYGDSNSTREADYQNFIESLEAVHAYQKAHCDIHFLFYLNYMSNGPIDATVVHDEAVQNRVRAWSEPKMWNLLRAVPKFQICFENERRTWLLIENISQYTMGKVNDDFKVNGLGWSNAMSVAVVRYYSPFN